MYTRRRSQVGVVVSDKMAKTVVVAVEKHKRHPLYKKTMRRTLRYKAHDEKGTASLGDTVRIIESRPLSREKRWRVAEVITRREVAEIAPREIGASVLEEIGSAAAKRPLGAGELAEFEDSLPEVSEEVSAEAVLEEPALEAAGGPAPEAEAEAPPEAEAGSEQAAAAEAEAAAESEVEPEAEANAAAESEAEPAEVEEAAPAEAEQAGEEQAEEEQKE